MAKQLIIFDTSTSHLDSSNVCSYDRSGTQLTLYCNDLDDILTDDNVQLFTTSAGADTEDDTLEWTFSGDAGGNWFYVQSIEGTSRHGAIKILPTGVTASGTDGKFSACPPIYSIEFQDDNGNAITNANEGDTVKIYVDAFSDTSLNGNTVSLQIDGTYNGATIDDISISSLTDIVLSVGSSVGADSRQFTGELGFDIVSDADPTEELVIIATPEQVGSSAQTITLNLLAAPTPTPTATPTATPTPTPTPLPDFTCALAAVNVDDLNGLAVGTTIDSNDIQISNGGTFNSITPLVIGSNTQTYDVVVNVPSGYNNNGTITCQVTIAGDSAPTANDNTISATQGISTVIDLFNLVIDDNTSDSNLTWSISESSTFNGTLSTFNQATGAIIYTAPQISFGSPAIQDIFTYTVGDSIGQTATGTITINVSAASNTAPTFNNTPYNISVELNSTEPIVFPFSATDQENQNITYSISVPTFGTATIDFSTNTFSYLTAVGNTAPDSFVITATDSEGASSSETVNVTISAGTYYAFNKTGFFASEDEACLTETINIGYARVTQSTKISDIAVGDEIYLDETGNLFISNNVSKYFKITQLTGNGNLLEQVISVNSSGIVESVSSCSVQSDKFKETLVRYSGSETSICNNFGGEKVKVAYGVNDSSDPAKDLQTLVADNTILFVSSYWANQYSNGFNEDLEGQIPAGLYQAEFETSTYYKRGTENNWVSNPGGWSCPPEIVYSTYELSNIYYADNIDELCNGKTTTTSLWYSLPEGEATKDFDTIVNLNIPVYTSQLTASENTIEGLAQSGVYSNNLDGSGYVWNNEGDGFDFSWFGFNSQNQFIKSNGSTQIFTQNCNIIKAPNINLNNLPGEIEGDRGINDTNVYYAFYGCEAYEDQDNRLGTESYYWKLYVVDAGVDVVLDENVTVQVGQSYLNDFINTWRDSSTADYSTDIVFQPNGFKCVSYVNTIYAEDINNAANKLSDHGYGAINDIKIVTTNPVNLGFGSENTVNIYSTCFDCRNELNIKDSYTFPVVNDAALDALGPNFDLETNYKLDNVSKPLLRTNPKLTTNVKLVVNSEDKLYLESISATKELAAIEYKKFPINKDGKYSYDVANFYNVNMTPNDLMFTTKRDYSDITVLDSYEKQLEETYQYGTNYNASKLHSEDFRIFAPIWLDTNIPKNFVIYRVNDPVGSLNLGNNAADNFNRIKSILKNSEIIETFDLTRDSNIGNYLRNHIQDETFPSSPLTINFEKSAKSSFNGIDLIKGGFTRKAEYLYKSYSLTDKPLIEANDFITDSFKRNEIASANLINLEFLFNDDSATEYSINRYFGIYVDDIESGYGRVVSVDGKVYTFKELNSTVDANVPETAIPSYNQISNMPMLGYVSAGNKFFNISSNTYYDANQWKVAVEDGSNKIQEHLGIQSTNRSVDLVSNDDHGYDFIKLSIIDTPYTNDSLGITYIKEEANRFTFIKHVANQTIKFEIDDPSDFQNTLTFSVNSQSTITDTIAAIKTRVETETDEDLPLFKEIYDITFDDKSIFLTEKRANLGDFNLRITSQGDCIIRNDSIQTNVGLEKHTYYAESQLEAKSFKGLRYSNLGTSTDIAVALSSCINANETEFTSINVGANVYIISNVSGYQLMQSCVLLGKTNVNDFVLLENLDSLNKLNLRQNFQFLSGQAILQKFNAYYLSGGNAPEKSVFVNNETVSEININDYIETRYKGVYNKVIDIVEDIRTSDNIYSKVILEDKNDLSSGDTKIFYENEIRLGLFSAYNIYDMNFDFYDTDNSELKELAYETQEEIEYEPYINAINNIDEATGIETTILSARDIFSEDFELNPINYFSNLSKILTEESVDEEEDEQLTSEYDRLKENNLKKYATNSRIVPNINKWVLKDTVTVREQPYYLNVNEAFGRTNFSPDLTVSERSRESMTHEWFYLEKPPKYLKYNQLNDTFSYVNFIEGFDLSANLFKSTTNNYFDKFMISDGFEKTLTSEDLVSIYSDINENDTELNSLEGEITSFIKTNILKKYTLIEGGNNVSFASTIFKGIKVDFKNRKEFVNSTASEFVNSSEFNGYKFSILLKVNDNVETNSIEYEVIQNKEFKFVIMYITLNLGDYWIDGNMNRKLLYELNHKIVFDSNQNDFTYADTKFNGALQFNSTSVNWAEEGPYTIPGIPHLNGSLPKFDSQITLGDDGLYGDIYIDLFPNDDTNSIYKVSVAGVESDNSIKITGKPVNDNGDILNIEFLPNSIQKNASYSYVGGGANAHRVILENLTAKSVADLVNLNNDDVTYTTIESDGTILNNQFVINFSDGTEIITRSDLNIEEDTDKPKSFKLFKGNIGYNLIKEQEYYPFLIRQNGKYTVDMKPVVTFTDAYSHFKVNRLHLTSNDNELLFEQSLYKHSLTDITEFNRAAAYYKKYNKCGIVFNLGYISDTGNHDSNWGLIKNHFYHKVNEINPGGVTKLSATSDKLPLYPLIGEIAIDKKDVNVFRSSWDSDYYTRSLAGGNSTNVPGTLDTHEERSYMSSTVMKPKYSYNLLDFNTSYVSSEEELDDILRNGDNSSDTVLFENKNYIIIDFYISDTLITKLAKEGVLDSISKYVLPANSAGNKETLNDDALMYAENNLIKTYILDSVQLYTKQFKGKGSKIINAVTVDQLDADGFTPDNNNFAYRNHIQKPMNFRLIYNKRLGYSYDIKPMIKIKS